MDASSPTAVLRLVLPQLPFLFKSAIWHSLWLSPTSTKWDLKTELVIKLIRSLMDSPTPSPISKQQGWGLKDPGIKGPMWISKVTLPRPEDNAVREAVMGAIDALKDGQEIVTTPEILPVEAEWTGFRKGVSVNRPRLDLSEEQHYTRLMQEVSSDVTILYFHGGAYYLMDPSSHRVPCSRLAKMTRGRCLSVRYRLAPQNPFPAALLDALIAYLSLLSPPPGSYHSEVPAKHIVFAGDSAGGGLATSLLQLILQLRRSSPFGRSPTVRFHGQDVPIPVPAGVAVNSAWLDITRCMPSITTNAHYDYLPPPPSDDYITHFPRCEIWPTEPPRGDLYCDTSLLCHPLVSPLAAKDWSGSCPLWMGYGEEMLADEGKALARRASRQGVQVVWEQFEAMPHCFAMLFDGLEGGKKYMADWANFCCQVVEGKGVSIDGKWVQAKTLKETMIVVQDLNTLSDDEIRQRMCNARNKRAKGIEGEAKVLPRL